MGCVGSANPTRPFPQLRTIVAVARLNRARDQNQLRYLVTPAISSFPGFETYEVLSVNTAVPDDRSPANCAGEVAFGGAVFAEPTQSALNTTPIRVSLD